MRRSVREVQAHLRRPQARVVVVALAVVATATSVRTGLGTFVAEVGVIDLALAPPRDVANLWVVEVAVLVACADLGAARVATGRWQLAWVSGYGRAAQASRLVGPALVLTGVCLVTFVLSRIVGAVLTLVANDAGLSLGAHQPLEPVAQLRVVAATSLLGVLGVWLGAGLRRSLAAMAIAGAVMVPSTQLADPLFVRAPDLVDILALTPGGAFTVIVEANAGVPASRSVSTLLVGRDPAWGALVLAVWLGVAWLAATRRAPSTHRRTIGARQALRPVAVGMLIAGIVGFVLPTTTADALPWWLAPAWLDARLDGRASPQVVEAFAGAIRTGDRAGAEALAVEGASVSPDDPFWAPLRRAPEIDVATEREMSGPTSVPVHVPVGEDAVTYRFDLVDLGGTWRIQAVVASAER